MSLAIMWQSPCVFVEPASSSKPLNLREGPHPGLRLLQLQGSLDTYWLESDSIHLIVPDQNVGTVPLVCCLQCLEHIQSQG